MTFFVRCPTRRRKDEDEAALSLDFAEWSLDTKVKLSARVG
jgi:hypothetical protein